MTKSPDPTLTEAARDAIAALFDAFCAATRMPLTLVSHVVSDDPAFVSRYRRVDLRMSSYDRVAGRFSALWPDQVAWPDGIPRPAPQEIPETLLGKMNGREPRYSRPPKLPGRAEWPADIPLPAPATPDQGA